MAKHSLNCFFPNKPNTAVQKIGFVLLFLLGVANPHAAHSIEVIKVPIPYNNSEGIHFFVDSEPLITKSDLELIVESIRIPVSELSWIEETNRIRIEYNPKENPALSEHFVQGEESAFRIEIRIHEILGNNIVGSIFNYNCPALIQDDEVECQYELTGNETISSELQDNLASEDQAGVLEEESNGIVESVIFTNTSSNVNGPADTNELGLSDVNLRNGIEGVTVTSSEQQELNNLASYHLVTIFLLIVLGFVIATFSRFSFNSLEKRHIKQSRAIASIGSDLQYFQASSRNHDLVLKSSLTSIESRVENLNSLISSLVREGGRQNAEQATRISQDADRSIDQEESSSDLTQPDISLPDFEEDHIRDTWSNIETKLARKRNKLNSHTQKNSSQVEFAIEFQCNYRRLLSFVLESDSRFFNRNTIEQARIRIREVDRYQLTRVSKIRTSLNSIESLVKQGSKLKRDEQRNMQVKATHLLDGLSDKELSIDLSRAEEEFLAVQNEGFFDFLADVFADLDRDSMDNPNHRKLKRTISKLGFKQQSIKIDMDVYSERKHDVVGSFPSPSARSRLTITKIERPGIIDAQGNVLRKASVMTNMAG